MVKKILVAFDGSPKSYEAFDFAVGLASSCGSHTGISVLSVVQPPESLYFVESDSMIDAATGHYKELLKELEAKAGQKDLSITTDVAVGHPADRIVKYAKEKGCDLIVMGQKGKSAIEGFLLGSVSRRVATQAHCTVTIVK
ncbi:MAG: universal stress protein [Nitrospiraceae bacterium]|nr:universal stress protein [Nitrospiraceae bacterium]